MSRLQLPSSAQRFLLCILIGLAGLSLLVAGWRLVAVDAHGEARPRPREASIEIQAGETLPQALARGGVTAGDVREAVAVLGRATDVGQLQNGAALEAAFSPGPQAGRARLIGLSLQTGPDSAITLSRGFDGALRPTTQDANVRGVTTVADGTLQGSLYESAERAGADPALIAQVIKLFSHKLDLARDIRTGDRFRLVFDRKVTGEGRTVETGALLYAEIGDSGDITRFYAFDHDGRTAFFDENGRTIKGLLLATPVDGARISSSFGMRDHPLLGYTRMHQGVDFAVETGTPVLAAGDGVVVEEKVWGGYGNWLRIRHADGWETGYAHLSRYATGLRPGMAVTQGQVVAYVGATGLATGPHLHYEVWRDGERVNPLGARIPQGVELTGDELMRFNIQKARIDGLRMAAPRTAPTTIASAAAAAGLKPSL